VVFRPPDYVYRLPGGRYGDFVKRLGTVPEQYRPRGVTRDIDWSQVERIMQRLEQTKKKVIPELTRQVNQMVRAPDYIDYIIKCKEDPYSCGPLSFTPKHVKDVVSGVGGKIEEWFKEHDVGGKLEKFGLFILVLLILIILAKR